jgi:hypothetical protein
LVSFFINLVNKFKTIFEFLFPISFLGDDLVESKDPLKLLSFDRVVKLDKWFQSCQIVFNIIEVATIDRLDENL